ncbi:hypothetical protein BCR44DRAFT_1426445, partial [Catenaria anguillulae PL171]
MQFLPLSQLHHFHSNQPSANHDWTAPASRPGVPRQGQGPTASSAAKALDDGRRAPVCCPHARSCSCFF